jgi:superoxide oxidase
VENGQMRSLTTAGPLVLCGLMIALPLTGWYAASGLGVPVRVFGIQIPAITASIPGPPGPIAEWHEVAGNLILVLAGVHALVALCQQFILKDGTRKRISLG